MAIKLLGLAIMTQEGHTWQHILDLSLLLLRLVMQVDLIFGTRADGSDAVPTERARLTKDGNCLVGKTATTYNTEGCNSVAGGHIRKNLANAFNFNRTGNSGALVSFQQAGGTVGSSQRYRLYDSLQHLIRLSPKRR
jgi:hypothetical protein